MVYEKELEESINNSLTRTWSHLNDLSNGIKGLGGGVQIAGAEDEEDSEKRERNREKKKKRGGVNSSPGDQSRAETPQSLAELSFFSRWLFRVTRFYVGSYGKLSSWDLVFLLLLCMCLCL